MKRANNSLIRLFVSIVLLLCTFSPMVNSRAWAGINEWTSYGPSGAYTYSIAISPNFTADHTVFAGTYKGGIYKSINGGSTWNEASSGLLNKEIRSIAISPNFTTDHTVFAGTYGGGIYKSTDGGVIWIQANNGITNYDILAISISPNFLSDKTIFIGTIQGGVYKSTDSGTTWIRLDLGNQIDASSIAISPNYASDRTLFAGSSGGSGIYKSVDGGLTWAQINNGLVSLYGHSVAVSPSYATDNTIYAGTYQGVYKSTNGGLIWTQVLDETYPIGSNGFFHMSVHSVILSPNYVSDRTVFAGSDFGGIYKSIDAGITWTQVNDGITNNRILSMMLSPNYASDGIVFAGSGGNGVFRSSNNGTIWAEVNTGINSTEIFSVASSLNYSNDTTIFASSRAGIIYKSTDEGTNWSEINLGILSEEVNIALSPNYAIDKTVFAGTVANGNSGGIYKSIDGGLTWNMINGGIQNTLINKIAVSPSYASDTTIFIGGWFQGGVHKSIDGGSTWTQLNNGLTPNGIADYMVRYIAISPNYAADQTVFVATDTGLHKSTNGALNWTKVGNFNMVFPIAVSPNYAQDHTVFVGGFSGYIYKSVDGGVNWTYSNVSTFLVRSLAISPNYSTDKTVFVGTYENGVFESTDGGLTWTQINNGFASPLPSIFAIDVPVNFLTNRTLFVGTGGNAVYRYTLSSQPSDTAPPTTTTSPSGGTYDSARNVTLLCNDGSGSGCQTTRYCLGNGCTPSTTYSGAINIPSSNTLRFYSTDNANNPESVKTETYTITPQLTHSITASAVGLNGSITPSGSVTVNHNATQSFTVNPDSGYLAVMSGTCGGNLNGTIYTTNPITADCSVIASFNPTGASQYMPPGENVQISVPISGNGTVTVTFDNVTTGGILTITTDTPGGGPPTGFKFLGTYYDVSFTGVFSGYVYITFPYNDSSIPSGKEANLRLFHWKNNGWEDCTSSLDTNGNKITGRVNSLSPFGFGYPYSSGSGSSAVGRGTGANENMIAFAILAILAGVFVLRRKKRIS